uniref:Uncharacterized protein n=1 Tax=Anguilla anguilla TaxID=7936 RepID=A0A0E9S3H0_ANGAN
MCDHTISSQTAQMVSSFRKANIMFLSESLRAPAACVERQEDCFFFCCFFNSKSCYLML